MYLGRGLLFSFLIFVLSLSWHQGLALETVQFSEKYYLDEISLKRARFDQRQFRTFVLPNQLEVLVIHDPKATKSTAALDVGVGLFQDPQSFPGMAHYLEHMLFLGTKKYPIVEEYSEFMSKNGGSNNAYTTEEHTNYHFEINSSAFYQALDRFAQFFIAPEFNPNYLKKELRNIDSEYSLHLDDLSFRQMHLLRVLGNPRHPSSRVFQGNFETLSGITRDVMMDHYQRYYSANLMKLAIISSLPIDEVESVVKAMFHLIPNRDVRLPKISVPVTSRGSLPRMIQIGAESSNFNLTLHFSLPSSQEYILSQPHKLIRSLLRYEGEGSLALALKKRGWISGLDAFTTDQSFGSSLDVVFEITPKGLANSEKIITLFFGYIRELKERGLDLQFFSNIKRAEELKVVFSSPSDGMDSAISYAAKMHEVSPPEIETLGHLLIRYSPQSYLEVLNEIIPEAVQVILAGNLQTDRKEPFYNIDYSVERFEKKIISNWKRAQPLSEFKFPPANPYFPEHFSTAGISQPFPTQIRKDERSELWIQIDHSFHEPKAVIELDIVLPNPKSNDESALRSLFEKVIQDSMLDLRMQGEQAKLVMSFLKTETGYRLSFGGFSDKITDFARDVITRLSRIDMSGIQFQNEKIDLIQNIASDEIDCQQCLVTLLNPPVKTADEMFPAVLNANVRRLDAFLWQLFSRTYLRGFGFGDISSESVQEIADHFLTTFRSEGLSPDEFPIRERVKLPRGKEFVRKFEMPGADNIWMSYHQFGVTTSESEMSLILGSKFLETAFYTEMRTNRTLGYVVTSFPWINSLSCGMVFEIESNQSLVKVRRIAEEWIQSKVMEFPAISEAEFEGLRRAALEELDRPAMNFSEKFALFDTAIMEKDGDFNWRQKKIDALKTISRETVSRIWINAFRSDRKRKITLAGFGDSAPHSWKRSRGEIEVGDAEEFKASMKKFKHP